jgi:hypothetical protein
MIQVMFFKSIKMLLALFVSFSILSLYQSPTFAASDEIKVVINGKQIYFPVNPQLIGERTFVPLRGIFEALGATVGWDGETQTVTGKKNDKIVVLRINDKNATVDGKNVTLDAPATIVDGSTLVPVRFIAESLGAEVKWEGDTNTVIISDGNAVVDGYYYFIYNSNSVSDDDLAAIKSYVNKFKSTNNILVDVAGIQDALGVYEKLKNDSASRSGKLQGIQIFGASEDVPAFHFSSGTRMVFPDRNLSKFDRVTEGELFLTDYFYSNFQNSDDQLKKQISPYAVFDEKSVSIDFTPQWKVVRLPLSKGEIAGYLKKFDDYTIQRKAQGSVPVVDFSSPTFGNVPQTSDDALNFRDPSNEKRLKYQKDDYSYFIERLDKEFHILDNYRLYGNQQGDIKVKSNVVGDFTKENVAKENETGIVDFIFNGADGFIKTKMKVTERGDRSPKIDLDQSEHIIDVDNVNDVFSKNYYTAALLGKYADNLSNNSLVHEMMANGKAMNVFAGSTNISANGLNNVAKLDDLKTTMYYFIYSFYDNQHKGLNRTDSYFNAAKAFEDELLKHQDLKWDPNFELGISNLVSLHDLGVIEY